MNIPSTPLRIAASILLMALLPGCAITQHVNPAKVSAGTEICVLENPAVREGFLEALKDSVVASGYRYRQLPPTAKTDECPVALTYVGRWS
jgi:hypothetical protein